MALEWWSSVQHSHLQSYTGKALECIELEKQLNLLHVAEQLY